MDGSYNLNAQTVAGICVAALVTLYGLNFVINDCDEKLGLVAVNTLITNSYVWNLATSCFYERHILKLLMDVTGLILYGSHQIKFSPFDQFALFLALSVISCSVTTSIWCFGRFFFTGLETMILEPIYGFSGVFITILMHGRSQLRETPILAQIPNITFNNFPVIYLAVEVLLWTIGLKYLAKDLLFAVVGLLFSWSYLRFYIRNEDGELGDHSEEFSFVNMFPEACHVVVIPFSLAFYNIAAILGIFPRIEQQTEKKHSHHLRYEDPSSTSSTTLLSTQTKAVDIVSERRKAKAIKLLNAKLSELSKESEGWDHTCCLLLKTTILRIFMTSFLILFMVIKQDEESDGAVLV